MGINEIVYCCKDNPKLLDELVVNYAITELDYEKAKMIIADQELCALACEKYLQGVAGAKDVSPSIPLKRKPKKDKKSKKMPLIGLTGVIVVAAAFTIFQMVTAQTIDISENVIVKMNQDAYSKSATASDIKYFSNIDYYRTDGDYDDMLAKFEGQGLSKKEAESLVPKYDEATSNYLSGLNIVPVASKEKEITNGDEIEINFEYDKGYARKHNLKVVGTKQTLKIKDLKEYVDETNYKTADMSELKDICDDRLSDEDLKQTLEDSIFYNFSEPTPCYLAVGKGGSDTDLILYRSFKGSKMSQGTAWGEKLNYSVRLQAYIEDNKYVVSYQGDISDPLEELYEGDSYETYEQLPTEDDFYIAEVK